MDLNCDTILGMGILHEDYQMPFTCIFNHSTGGPQNLDISQNNCILNNVVSPRCKAITFVIVLTFA